MPLDYLEVRLDLWESSWIVGLVEGLNEPIGNYININIEIENLDLATDIKIIEIMWVIVINNEFTWNPDLISTHQVVSIVIHKPEGGIEPS